MPYIKDLIMPYIREPFFHQALAVGVTDLAGAVGVEAKAPRAEGQGGRRTSR